MVGQPFLSTNIAKLLFAFTDDRITALLPLYRLFAVRANPIIQKLNKLSGILSQLPPITNLITYSSPMILLATSWTHKISTSTTLNNIKHLIYCKAAVTCYPWSSFTHLDCFVVGCVTSA